MDRIRFREEHRQRPPRQGNTSPLPVLSRSQCSKCGGVGYLRQDVPFGHPNFGKPKICSCKEAEIKVKEQIRLIERSNVLNLGRYSESSFANFITTVPGVLAAKTAALEFAADPVGWLVLQGGTGSGKTHLAVAIAKELIDQGIPVMFETVPDLLDHLRFAFAPTATEVYDQLFNEMREIEVLFLDDYGAHKSSPWATEKLFQLLNHRYNYGRTTVITTNVMKLETIDERVASRMTDVSLSRTIIMKDARDYRKGAPPVLPAPAPPVQGEDDL